MADLTVDAIYEGGRSGTFADDPISKVLSGTGNQGGFRYAGRGMIKKYVALFSSGEDRDWPDKLDLNIGRFTYYGDNKSPGHELHDTHRGGNFILRKVFDELHSTSSDFRKIPPFFVFTKYQTKSSSRSAQFRGLAAPGGPGVPATEDLTAVWKTAGNNRFQNYKALFTIFDIPVVSRLWIEDLRESRILTDNTPAPWRKWVESGVYSPLQSKPTTTVRSVAQQTPVAPLEMNILKLIYKHFKDAPTAFESFATRIFKMIDDRILVDEITRGTVDGGRDAIGRYRLGLNSDPVCIEFSLEAKCYRPALGAWKPTIVGVKDVSRLISRIRHREFGVMVTTSAIGKQAYSEVREDGHPIVFISGKDIAETLVSNGYNSLELVRFFLEREFLI